MGKFSFEEVNELYVDVLREIGNIGSGFPSRNSVLQFQQRMKPL